MIEIDLLPEEYRRPEMTPLPRRLVIYIGAALISSCLFVLIWFHFIHLPSLRNVKDDLINQERMKAQEVKKYEELTAEINRFNQRRQTIEQIWQTRVLWARKLDQLCDLVPSYIWFSNVSLQEPHMAEKDVGGKLLLDCHSQGPDVNHFAEFLRILQGQYEGEKGRIGQEFFDDFISLTSSGWTKKILRDYEPPEALEFRLELSLEKKDIAAVPGQARAPGSPPVR
jgi:Tfp pilus assembly protein PilN